MPSKFSEIGLSPSGQDLNSLLDQVQEFGWQYLDEGHHATVFHHPAYPETILRAGNCIDGMARWFLLSRGPLRRFVGLHVPVIHDLALTSDGGMFLLAERLVPPDEGDPLLTEARALLCGRPGDPEVRRRLLLAQPGLEDFAQALRQALPRPPDVREGNLLLRGPHLILNDPSGVCLTAQEVQTLEDALPAYLERAAVSPLSIEEKNRPCFAPST